MELTPIQAAVLQILSWQTPGYLCSSLSSAFVSQGLENPTQIEEACISMQEDGYVEFYTLEESTDLIQVERTEAGEPVLSEETGAIIPLTDEEGNLQIETVTKTVDAGWIITDAGRALLNA